MRRRGVRIALSLALLLAAALLAWRGVYREPREWWYPFVPAVLTDHYTAGPFAMTSNTREDNPVWQQMPAFNRTLARLSYAARRGEPAAQVAWLLPQGGWKDEPSFNLRGIVPNARESATSRALADAGYEYDRVSRRALGAAAVRDGALLVGQASYRALLVSELHSASPELLERIAEIARAGVPVLWLGDFPARASGWSDHARRDAAVRALLPELRARVEALDTAASLRTALEARSLRPVLAPTDGGPMPLRVHRRRAGDEEILLLFNPADETVTGRYALAGRPREAALLDPASGEAKEVALHAEASGAVLELTIPARRTHVLRLLHAPGAIDAAGVASAAETWRDADWREPPLALHPAVRWWWPGNAVEPDELLRELHSLHAAGFGRVEIQTLTLGMRRSDLLAQRERIYQVGTPAWLANVGTVIAEARRLGMGVDLTLGSGWSSGGPFVRAHPEQQLLAAHVDVDGPGPVDVAVPAATEPGYVATTNRVVPRTIGAFDTATRRVAVIAAPIDESTDPPTLGKPVDLAGAVHDGRIAWVAPAGRHRIFAFHQNGSAHNAAGSAYPGALERSPIVDHLDPAGTREYIDTLGDPWLDALAPLAPDEVFVDSFELIGELPWSDRFAQAFRDMHGYALEPWLPFAFHKDGESKYTEAFNPPSPAYRATDDRAQRIREDYEATREQLFLTAFVEPLQAWSRQRGVGLRLQAHGGWGDYLDAYAAADVPESEGLFAGGSFDFLKLASSAAHVAGRTTVSSESFITLGLDFNRLGIEDYHLLAGNAFAAGINRTVCHGYAYHLPLTTLRER